MNGSVGRTGQESRADHSTCQAAGSEGARGTNHPASAVGTAPARHRITGAEGPTLPPPIRPRRPPRPGVLAAGRAGTAAGGPGPEASCHCQPWLKLRGYPTGSGLAPHRPPPARREDGAGRDETEELPGRSWPRLQVGGAFAWLSGDPDVRASKALSIRSLLLPQPTTQ